MEKPTRHRRPPLLNPPRAAALPSFPVSARATFAPLAAGQVDHAARTLRDCSLDRVDDHDAQPDNDIARGDKVMLAGWAGDSVTQMVAPSLQIVLQGAQDYAASAPTGYPRRNDVAKFKDIPAFV